MDAPAIYGQLLDIHCESKLTRHTTHADSFATH